MSEKDSDNIKLHKVFEGVVVLLTCISVLCAVVSCCYWSMLWCCRGCCSCLACCLPCRSLVAKHQPKQVECSETVRVEGMDVSIPVQHLRKRKELCTAYVLWCFTGLMGAHHFYLDRVLHGCLSMWSLNFLGVGWLIDGLLMSSYLRGTNRLAAPSSLPDGSTARICVQLPSLMIVMCVLAITVLVKGPTLVHKSGLVDVQQLAAGTSINPYELLDLSPDSDESAAENAYMAMFLKHRNECVHNCTARLTDLKRARNYTTGEKWRLEAEHSRFEQGEDSARDWERWSAMRTHEWMALATELKGLISRAGAAYTSSTGKASSSGEQQDEL